MKRWLMAGVSSMVFLFGCSEAQFFGSSGDRSVRTKDVADPNDPNTPGGPGNGDLNGGGDGDSAIPDVPQINPENPPVDPTDNNPNGPQPGGPDEKDEVTFNLACDEGQTTIAEVDFEADRKTEVTARVKGEFCPTSTNELNVVFVVDYSGSMGKHVNRETREERDGNDPQVDGSCGRLRAAEAIIAKLQAERGAADQINVAMLPFAGDIVNARRVAMSDLDGFEGSLNKDYFCSYVTQNGYYGYDPVNPGGIDGGAVDSSTNYRAAFAATQDLLQGRTGRKVVYFISDGEPTSGGANPAAAGAEAGADLRATVDNLVVNGLLLGEQDVAAEGVLEQVTGSEDRVRYARDADALAEEILQFPVASIRAATGDATIEVVPNPVMDLGLITLAQDNTREMVWTYETQPFLLAGLPGEDVDNVVTVTALGQDGSTHRQTVRIRFRQK